MAPNQTLSREKLTIRQVPQKIPHGEEEIFGDFSKLHFTPGPFPSSDEINYNDGLEGNPFDKICKAYGRHKDLFLFNAVLSNAEKRQKILEICEEKCAVLEDSEGLMSQFKKRMNVYLKRVEGGAQDAKTVLGGDLEGFFHGCHFAKRGQVRNIHANLNVNVSSSGAVLETNKILTEMTPRMMAEGSHLERVKIYGNGKRIMNVVKGPQGVRNYCFSKLAKMELEMEWIGREPKTGREVVCTLVLEMNGGRVGVKMASVDGVALEGKGLEGIMEFARENHEVLVRGKSLAKILEETLDAKVVKQVDCSSEEALTIGQLQDNPVDYKTVLKEVLMDIEKLEVSSNGPLDPNDKLNYNEGRKANPFNKLRKFYGREKNIFWLIGVLSDESGREEILKTVKGKYGEDLEGLQDFQKCLNRFLENVEDGRKRAREFIGGNGEKGIDAFFEGYHVPDEYHTVNIDANLNVDLMDKEIRSEALPLSGWFEGRQQLERVKVFGNGRKLVTVSREGQSSPDQRNYLFTRFAEMSLEVTWTALVGGEGVGGTKQCLAMVNVKNGRATVGKCLVDGVEVEPWNILELISQNDKVFFRNKSLCHLVAGRTNDKAKGCLSKEMLTFGSLPPEHLCESLEHPDFQELLAVIEKLDVSNGPFDPDDKLNYNEGQHANPFTKLRKFYGKEKNIFLLIGVLSDTGTREEIMNVVRAKYQEDLEGFNEFERCLNKFLERVRDGMCRATELLGEGYGEVVAFLAGTLQNTDANLNVNLMEEKENTSFPVSDWFGRAEGSKVGRELERVKMFASGRRLVTVSKMGTGVRQRNYQFSRFADARLEVEWKGGNGRNCHVLLSIAEGKVTMDKAEVDGSVVEPRAILEHAILNDELLFRNKSLYAVCGGGDEEI